MESKSKIIFCLLLEVINNYYCKTFIRKISGVCVYSMHKIIFLKKGLLGILVIWFLLCIVPGDCLLLGCDEKDLLHCAEKELVLLSHNDADSHIPMGDQHCSHCCVLCAHNFVMGLLQNSSLFLSSSSSLFKTLHFNHSKSIFQTIIYHPPRIAV